MIKKIGVAILCSLLGLIIIGSTIVYVFEEDIKSYALDQIGQQLVSDIKVKEVSLTLWDQFPSASLQFKEVLIEETFAGHDTLIFAENVFLNFSVLDFVTGSYEVNEIAIDEAEINLKRKITGEDNYHFWKSSDEESAEFKLDLSKVILSNALVNFDDKQTGLDLSVTALNSNISGSVTQEILDLSGDINTHVHWLNVSNQSYLFDKTLSGTAGLTIDLEKDLYTFSPSILAINELPLHLSGSVDLEKEASFLNLKAESKGANLSTVIANLPAFVKQKLSSFNSAGDFNTVIRVTGAVKSGVMPKIEAAFSLANGQLTNNDNGVTLSDISTSGTYSAAHGKEDLLVLKDVSLVLGSGKLSGNGKISRLSNPFINTSLQGNFDLEELNQFFDLEQIDEMSGNALVNLNYKGNFGNNWQASAASIRSAVISGDVVISDATILIKDNPHQISSISGKATLSENNALVDRLSAQMEESDFTFDGSFKNLIPYLLIPEEKLLVTANLNSNYLDFNSLLSNSDESDELYYINFPDHFEFDLNTTISTLKFRQFTAQNISAHTRLNNKRLNINPLKLNTSEGTFTAEIVAEQLKGGDFKVFSQGDIKNVDISDLFKSFENFQQEFITNTHLKGVSTSDYTFSAIMSNTMALKSETAEVTAHITLKNGELIDHESLAEMASYMKDKKLMSALTDMPAFSEKLAHIKFSELSNTIIIKDSKITIPKMEIKSDALNIFAQGSHTFTNVIDYSIGFDLADLAARKNYTKEEKGLSKNIYLSMTGTTSNPKFGYDQLAVKEQRKEDRQDEKEIIKSLIKDEFAKKDPEAGEAQPKNSSMSVVWSEEQKSSEEKTKPTINIQNMAKLKKTPDLLPENDEDDDF